MPTIKCDDCGRYAKPDELIDREKHLGGVRHRRGYGCYPTQKQELVGELSKLDSGNLTYWNAMVKLIRDGEAVVTIGHDPPVDTTFPLAKKSIPDVAKKVMADHRQIEEKQSEANAALNRSFAHSCEHAP